MIIRDAEQYIHNTRNIRTQQSILPLRMPHISPQEAVGMGKRSAPAKPTPATSIPCTCDCDTRMERAQLQAFQGGLKELPERQYLQLKASMARWGFMTPVLVWDGRILDGHQRLAVLDGEGWTVDGGIPVVHIRAEDEAEAARKLLAITSAYGHVTEQGAAEFMQDHDIDIGEFTEIADFPGLDLGDVALGMDDEDPYSDSDDGKDEDARDVKSVFSAPPAVWLMQASEIIGKISPILAEYGMSAEWADHGE